MVKFNKFGIITFLFCLFIQLAILPNPSNSYVFENTSYHYSLEVPQDWVKMNPEAIKEFYAGFFKKNSSSKLPYPNMLIEHENARLSFDELVNQYKKDLNDLKLGDTGLTKESKFEKAIVDKHSKSIIIPATFEVDYVGNVKCISLISLGKSGIVKLYFYSLEKEFNSDSPIFNTIIDSFKFEEGYQSQISDNRLYSRNSLLSVILKMTIGAMIGIGIYRFISFLRSKNKGSKIID